MANGFGVLLFFKNYLFIKINRYIYIPVEQDMKENGLMIINAVMGKKLGLMEQNLKVNMLKGKKMVKDF